MGRTDLAVRLTRNDPALNRSAGRTSALPERHAAAARNLLVCSVTLVTKWLRSVDLSIRLVTLGDFSKGQENHHVGRGT
jgi:hypothetical protein